MKGAAQFAAKLRQLAADYPKRVAGALYVEANSIMTEAKRRTPVASDGGILRASGQVSLPIIDGTKISVTLSFGGAANSYAIAVHETPSQYDPPSWKIMYQRGGEIQWTSSGTGSKFLEQPLNEAMPDMLARLAARLHLDQE